MDEFPSSEDLADQRHVKERGNIRMSDVGKAPRMSRLKIIQGPSNPLSTLLETI